MKKSYDTAKEEFDARSIFTCIFGCEEFKLDLVTAKVPVAPVRPKDYSGYKLSDFSAGWGLGTLMAGSLDMTANKIKAFGILGQTDAVNMGYALTQDVIIGEVSTCSKKTVMLNLYPDLGFVEENPTNSFSFDVQTGDYKTMDLDANLLTTKPADPSTPVKEADINKLLGVEDAAKYLSAASAALTLAALTLY